MSLRLEMRVAVCVPSCSCAIAAPSTGVIEKETNGCFAHRKYRYECVFIYVFCCCRCLFCSGTWPPAGPLIYINASERFSTEMKPTECGLREGSLDAGAGQRWRWMNNVYTPCATTLTCARHLGQLLAGAAPPPLPLSVTIFLAC